MKKLCYLLLTVILSNSVFGHAKFVKFQAEIANKNGDVIYIKTPENKTIKEIHANKEGIFVASFDVSEGLYILFDSSEYTLLYLKNGFDLKLKMDAKHFDESIVYEGKGAKENNYLAQKSLINEEFQGKMMSITNEKSFNEMIQEFKDKLNAKLKNKDLDPNFKTTAEGLIVSESKQMEMQFSEVLKVQKINGSVSASFNYENFAGGKSKLEDFKGKYVYIDVWATWCGPCRREIPFLQKIEEKYHDKNIAFVSISIDVQKDIEKWRALVKEKQLGGVQLIADKDWSSDFVTSFGIRGIPRFILIDPNGKVISADAERPSDPKLQERLDSLL